MKVRQIIRTLMATFVMVAALAVPVVMTSGNTAHAAVPTSVKNGVSNAAPDGASSDIKPFIKSVTSILLFIIGAASVILIIVGGLRYVTSGGDQSQISGAKNTILYAVIGLVVASMAYAIVNFVLGHV